MSKERKKLAEFVSAGDVAGGHTTLFSPNSMIKRINDDAVKQAVAFTQPTKKKKKADKPKKKSLAEQFDDMQSSSFDRTSVISQLRSLELDNKAADANTVVFGLEGDDGQIVRVAVAAEDAEGFESAMQSAMQSADESDETGVDLAELLYMLRDDFDIVDVTWPEVEENEEFEDQEFVGGENDEFGGEDLEGMDGEGLDGEGTDDLEGLEGEDELKMSAGGDEGEVSSLLAKVIDMMTADAAARQADAEARISDSRTKETEIGLKHILARIKQEEQLLDMEEERKSAKSEEQEVKRLAQLAKWKRDRAASAQDSENVYLDDFSSEENEEVRFGGKMSAQQLAKEIATRLDKRRVRR